MLNTPIGLHDCDLWYSPSQGYYVLYERVGSHYGEYKDEYGVVQTLRPRSVLRVRHDKDYGVLKLEVACGYTDEVRPIMVFPNDASDARELVDYFRGLGGVVVVERL